MNNKQVILVTGASSGIGKAIALQLIGEGHIVYGAARRVAQMSDLVAAGGHALMMDITNETQIAEGVRHVLTAHGRIDVLVNNAGYAVYGAMEDTDINDARRQFEVNFFGLARLTQLVLPQMRAQQSGKIINMSSMGGKIYTPLGSWYHATKHALEGWSDCLRLELAPFGIAVVIIEPGAIATEFVEVMNAPMLARSGKGAYAELAHRIAKAGEAMYNKPNMASPPTVIAREVAKAVRATRPKTRYAAGKFAKMGIWARLYLGDRLFDRMIMSQG